MNRQNQARNRRLLNVVTMRCGCINKREDAKYGRFLRIHRMHANGKKCATCGNLKVGR